MRSLAPRISETSKYQSNSSHVTDQNYIVFIDSYSEFIGQFFKGGGIIERRSPVFCTYKLAIQMNSKKSKCMCQLQFFQVNFKFLKERRNRHPAGSLDRTVEDLVKTFEMEATHKINPKVRLFTVSSLSALTTIIIPLSEINR